MSNNEIPNSSSMDYINEEDRLFLPLDASGSNVYGEAYGSRTEVTQESESFSGEVWKKVSDNVGIILREFGYETSPEDTEEQIRDRQQAIRENPSLRLVLGTFFRSEVTSNPETPLSVHDPHNFPHLKSPNFPGYDNMLPEDYAALLALAMLDGTFKKDVADVPRRYTKNGEISARHREAALIALGVSLDSRDKLMGTQILDEE